MAKPIVVLQDGLRIMVDPEDPDRKGQPVITYRLSPEEIEARYGHIKGSGERAIAAWPERRINEIEPIVGPEGEVENMNKDVNATRTVKITKEELIKECREHGLSPEAVQKIADKYGMEKKAVYSRISFYRIKQLLIEDVVSVGKPAAEEERKADIPAESLERPEACEVIQPQKTESLEQKKPKLSPVRWLGENRMYEFDETGLVVYTNGTGITVPDLTNFIIELQELESHMSSK